VAHVSVEVLAHRFVSGRLADRRTQIGRETDGDREGLERIISLDVSHGIIYTERSNSSQSLTAAQSKTRCIGLHGYRVAQKKPLPNHQ